MKRLPWGEPNVVEIRKALSATFDTRKTHPLPSILQPPPSAWKDEFVGMAMEAGISTTDYLVAFGILKEFFEKREWLNDRELPDFIPSAER